jgi:peptide-methionine (S)-S-oxide reductase
MVKRAERIDRADGATDTVAFGTGCFWCSEAAFSQLKGVTSVISGYAGGDKKNPTYEQVCSGTTGHAEVVKIEYDPDIISLSDLLAVFFTIHDPTTFNRQGDDIGSQYRSVVLYTTVEQKNLIKKYIGKLTHKGLWKDPIVTEIVPLESFYEASPEHYRYYENNQQNRYCHIVIAPKLVKLRKIHTNLLK